MRNNLFHSILVFPRKLFLKKSLIIVFFISIINPTFAQNLEAMAGVLFSFGQPVNRIGWTTSLFVYQDHLQATLACKGYYNFQNFGTKRGHWEIQPQIGISGAWGKKVENLAENSFYYSYFHRSQMPYAIGYQFQYYWNKLGTKQTSGTILLQLDSWHIQVENDAFGSLKGKDRFRTGAFRILYQKEDFLLELKSALWTGETRGKKLFVCREPSDYPCRWGYKDISKLPFGKTSHGVLGLQLHYALPYRQAAQLGLGIDAEQVRNFIQNKVIHDMYFLPKGIVKTKNLHYPMLDENGMPYLYQKEQNIRKKSWFALIGWNNEGFY